MTNILINKLPVVFISNYRTGCTEYSQRFANNLKCKWFSEPIRNQIRQKGFEDYMSNGNKNFVIKFMIDQFDDLPQYKTLLEDDNTKIRFLRHNELDQITSYYIAKMTDSWAQLTKHKEQYVLPLYEPLAKECIDIICTNNINLKNSNINFDYTLYYEDFLFEGDGVQFKTQPPINIKPIRQMLTTMYKESSYGS